MPSPLTKNSFKASCLGLEGLGLSLWGAGTGSSRPPLSALRRSRSSRGSRSRRDIAGLREKFVCSKPGLAHSRECDGKKKGNLGCPEASGYVGQRKGPAT